jgi:hypothetical protein
MSVTPKLRDDSYSNVIPNRKGGALSGAFLFILCSDYPSQV